MATKAQRRRLGANETSSQMHHDRTSPLGPVEEMLLFESEEHGADPATHDITGPTAAETAGQPVDTGGWEEASPDFADIWSPQKAGDTLEGIMLGRRIVATTTPQGAPRDTMLYEISLDGSRDVDSRRGVWGSYALDHKMSEVNDGDSVRIVYHGEDDFTADDGSPRRVKRFTVLFRRAK